MAKSFKTRLAERKKLGEQTDSLDEAIIEEFLTAASPIIGMLRDLKENMSDTTSFSTQAGRVLQQIDNGLLRDPLAVRVIAKMKSGEEAPSETPAEDPASSP